MTIDDIRDLILLEVKDKPELEKKISITFSAKVNSFFPGWITLRYKDKVVLHATSSTGFIQGAGFKISMYDKDKEDEVITILMKILKEIEDVVDN